MDSLQRGPLVQQCLSTDPAWFSQAPAPRVRSSAVLGAAGVHGAAQSGSGCAGLPKSGTSVIRT